MSVARQRFGKHIPVTVTINTTIEELLEAVFSKQSMESYMVRSSRTCTECLCGVEFEYLHCSPASHRR
jgi:hypothetical protein